MNCNIENTKMFFLVYKITNKINGMIYIGAHATIDINDSYFGSGKGLKLAIKEFRKENFVKEILFQFDNKKDMFKKERELVNREFVKRDDTYNRVLGGNDKAYTKGFVCVKDKEGKTSLVSIDDKRYLSGELIHILKGNKWLSEKLKSDIKFKKEFQINQSNKMKNAHKKGLINYNTFEGKNHSEETKEKMRKKAELRIGEKNSSYGTMWITNGVINKKIKKDSIIEEGFFKGRINATVG